MADNAGRSGGTGAVLSTVTSLPELDEQALVVEAQAGNRAAFEELVRQLTRRAAVALNLMKRPRGCRFTKPS